MGPSPSSPVYATGTLSYSVCLSSSKMDMDTGEVPLFPHCDPGRTSGYRGDRSRPHCRPQGQPLWPCRAQHACMVPPRLPPPASLSLIWRLSGRVASSPQGLFEVLPCYWHIQIFQLYCDIIDITLCEFMV